MQYLYDILKIKNNCEIKSAECLDASRATSEAFLNHEGTKDTKMHEVVFSVVPLCSFVCVAPSWFKKRLRHLLKFHLPSPGPVILQIRAQSFPVLKNTFDTLIETYIDNKIGIADNFLNASLAFGLKENLNMLYADHQMLSAGIGNDESVVHNKSIRSDIIYWLDRKHNNSAENNFFDLMDSFVSHLNETCYTGITGYEFHYTLYEKGSAYKKHLDQFKSNKSRQYSMVMYLNEEWQLQDGGELCIHHEDSLQNISPENGKTVFFKSSELEHEVLMTNKARLSITGWLKADG